MTRFVFGPFLLDLGSRALLRDGESLPINARTFDTLVVLVKNRGRLLDKDELLSLIWPDTVVDEANLSQSIFTVRKLLGDSPRDHRYIATIPGRGYQFVATVAELADPASHEQRIAYPTAQEISPRGGASASSMEEGAVLSSDISEVAENPHRAFQILPRDGSVLPGARHMDSVLRRRLFIGFLAAMFGGLLVVWALGRRPSRRIQLIERKLTANSSENRVRSMAVSADGRHLAYADNAGIDLKLIQRGETHAIPLPPNFSAQVDDWFSDGSHLLVSRTEQPGKVSLWSVSVFGGSPRRLADEASGGALSPDGSHIAFRRGELTYDGLWGKEEWVMRSDGTDQVKISSGSSDAAQMGAPTWSPDGKRIAYIKSIWAQNARTSSVQVNEWQKAKAETLLSDTRLSPALRWLPDGRLIYAFGSTQRQQVSSLWAVSPQKSSNISSAPKCINAGHGWISKIAASADGKVLTILRGDWLPSVYIGTLASDGTHLLGQRRLTLDENENLPSAWTPDSKAVLFSSDRNGAREIFKQAIDQVLPESLVSSSDDLSQPIVTPDGSEILYISTPKDQRPGTPSSILAIPLAGGTPRLVLKDSRIWNVQCAGSSSMTCFYSVTKGNTTDTFRFDVKSGKIARPPQMDPDCNWSLSPDGSNRAIVMFAPHQEKIKLRSTFTDKASELVINRWSGLMGINWSQDGKSLWVSWHPHQWDSALLNVTLDGKASVVLHSSNPEIWHAIPSPDGRWLAIAAASGARNVWEIGDF